ncbi:MAG: hypothetical protein IK058_00790 [Bacteroidales bacterium]|nr:hypothetical protein [Bacteroidales bacterium]
MRTRYIALLLPLLAVLLTGCDRNDDFTAPFFLHVEAINLVPQTQNAISTESGFYTSDIVAAAVYMRRKGSTHLDTIGHFKLPFTVPILYSGEIEFIDIHPAVKQSGSATRLPPYTPYNKIRISDTVAASGDTLWFDTLQTTYCITREEVLMFEPFEPTEGNLMFDSVMQWRPHAPTEACSGQGYGYVPVDTSTLTVTFGINCDFSVIDPQTHRLDKTRLAYLELDTRSDVEFGVYMEGAPITGSTTVRYGVMTVYKSDEWTHLYINLNPTWEYLNYCSSFRLYFTALNEDLINGEVRLDNVKLVTAN